MKETNFCSERLIQINFVITVQLGVPTEEPQPNIPPVKSNIDYSHEASEYEQKLIQVWLQNVFK